MLLSGTQSNSLPTLGQSREVTHQTLKDVLKREVTVIVQVNIHNTLSIYFKIVGWFIMYFFLMWGGEGGEGGVGGGWGRNYEGVSGGRGRGVGSGE